VRYKDELKLFLKSIDYHGEKPKVEISLVGNTNEDEVGSYEETLGKDLGMLDEEITFDVSSQS
jgi:hypothetical protein